MCMCLYNYCFEFFSFVCDVGIVCEVIFYGVDVVYIGGSGFGVCYNVSNSLSDIVGLVFFVYCFGVKVFVMLNIILYDDELELVQWLIIDFYDVGVDVLIVQDMGIMELDLLLIELYVSIQCDICSVEKVKFFFDVGFSQIVLVCELNFS